MSQATGPALQTLYVVEKCLHICWSSIDEHEAVQRPRPVAVYTATTLQGAVPVLIARMRNWVKDYVDIDLVYRFSAEYAAIQKVLEFKLKEGNLWRQWKTFSSLYLFANLSVLQQDGIWPMYVITGMVVGDTIPRSITILCRTRGCNLSNITVPDHIVQTMTSIVRCRRQNDRNDNEFKLQAKLSMANWLATRTFDRARWTLQKQNLIMRRVDMEYTKWRNAYLLLNAESDADSNDDCIWPAFDVISFVVQ